jgi:predicted 2-oxoglutarate/Fe(II)-dependent dioxygenase YbiX
MKGEWCYFKSFLDKQTCEKIINDAIQLPAQDAVVGTDDFAGTNNDIRRSKIRFLNKDDWRFTYIFDILWKTAISANHDFFNFHITKLDFIQFAEYDAQYLGEYKDHQDVFWISNDQEYHRKLIGIIQLSDPNAYEGGNFELINTSTTPPEKDVREQGTIFYFPSFTYHRANQVIRGKRYSIAAWFDGPKWR